MWVRSEAEIELHFTLLLDDVANLGCVHVADTLRFVYMGFLWHLKS